VKSDELDFDVMGDRFAYAIKSVGRKKVCDAIGLSEAHAYRISKGANTTIPIAVNIARATGFNLEWLATGEGPMKVDSELWTETDGFVDVERLDKNQSRADMKFNPSYLETDLGMSLDQCRQWVIDYDTAHKPYREGQTVLIDTQATNDGVYVICLGSTYQLVRIEHELNGRVTVYKDSMRGDGQLVEQSLAPEQLDALGVCGRIRWFGGRQ